MAEYFWLMTNVGLAKRAAAEAGGTAIDMRTGQFCVGDSNGAYYDPDAAQTALVNQRWSGPLNRVYISTHDATLMICEAMIPLDVGGWFIREVGIKDAAGDLIAIGKYPLIEKPDPSSGAARAEYIRGGFHISNGGSTVLQMDESLVFATQEELDNHALLTNPHSSTSLAFADRLVLRDGNGRACVAAPVDPEHIAVKATVDNHATLNNTHGATSLLAPNRLIIRDDDGRAKISSPVTDDDIANRGFVKYANLPDAPDLLLLINQTIYGVGKYYVDHEDSRNPNIILGFGTWVAMQGRFLLGVSATYPANTTGGEASHVLTIPEMPSHTHTGAILSASLAAGGTGTQVDWGTQNTGATGGNAAHNNMPPYETAYVWRRTA